MPTLASKLEKFKHILAGYSKLLVAFSGGVDSAFLLAVAHEVLHGNAVAATAMSPIHPKREGGQAYEYSQSLGVQHVRFASREMNDAYFTVNTKDRCYVCKKLLCEDLIRIGASFDIQVIAHGANADDLNDYRPGFKAAEEMGVVAPLIEAGMTKDDIRTLAKQMNIPAWNKPSMACLATRIPYGTQVTRPLLTMVERAEAFILNLGFSECRVRHYGDTARIELNASEIKKITDESLRHEIIREFRHIGFTFITIDLEGYTQGCMNRAIT